MPNALASELDTILAVHGFSNAGLEKIVALVQRERKLAAEEAIRLLSAPRPQNGLGWGESEAARV